MPDDSVRSEDWGPDYPQVSPLSENATTVLAAGLGGLDALDFPVPPDGPRVAVGKGWSVIWPKLAAIAIVFVIWEAVHLSGYKKLAIPGPGVTMSNLWAQAHTALLWHAIGTTLERAVLGFALATLIGSIIGALVSRNRPLRSAVGSLLTGLQTMPSIAWFPFAIILFGINTSAILFVIVLGAAPSIANGLIAGVDYTPPLLLKAGTMMGLRRVSLYRFLILPASLPTFVAGLKQGWAFAWRSLMAGELLVIIANQPSIGVLLSTYQDQFDMASVVAIMIVILIIGLGVDSAFGAADKALRRRWGLV
jgi:NitT/TauT family transport system permease protein